MAEGSIYSYFGVNQPNYAVQINSGNYIVSDYGNNRVIELDGTTPSLVRSYNIADPVFFDYSEENETLLITSESLNQVVEITWSDLDAGTVLWQSTISLNSPQCASYQQDNVNRIVIADTGNNKIVFYDRDENTYRSVLYYRMSENEAGPHEMSMLYKPYRIYQYSNGDVCVVEQEGKPLDFTKIESSSSSSSSSSLDSSSSSSSVDSSSSSSSSG